MRVYFDDEKGGGGSYHVAARIEQEQASADLYNIIFENEPDENTYFGMTRDEIVDMVRVAEIRELPEVVYGVSSRDFREGDFVHVLFLSDNTWYDAKVTSTVTGTTYPTQLATVAFPFDKQIIENFEISQ